MTPQAEAMYCSFSLGGIVEQFYSGGTQWIFCNETEGSASMPIFHELDLGDDMNGAVGVVVDNFKANTFGVFRTILKTATYHRQVVDGVNQKLGDNRSVIFVDPLELSLIARQSKTNGFGKC